MKNKILFFLFTALLFLIAGCSSSNLSKEDANNIAVEYAKAYVEKQNLNIPIDKIMVIQTEKVDKMNKWFVSIDYEGRQTEKLKLPPQVWITISDNKEIVGYNFTPWEGKYKPD